MNTTIHFTLNGKPVNLVVNADRKLLWVLRSDLHLTGVKFGCSEGYCGSCTVIVNGKAVRSCQLLVKDVQGKDVLTIGGLMSNGKLHPLQEAFIRNDALQCGFCTPGMILNAYGMLLKNPHPSRAEILQGMEDNLCRCGSYTRVVQAIEEAAKQMRKERPR